MSVLDEEEFVMLRKYKGKVKVENVERIIDLIEEEMKKTDKLKTAAIYVFANNVEEIKSNKELYEIILKTLEKFSPKLGFDNVVELIKSSIS
ncbi:hypothetical protein [Sulfuracidifex metallicus]|uniref:Calcium binding protein SSO6904 domain-containing protein n=1 Tax=Sulfuracidifex metallicus DSM 6482 = JCM 9184 TaxID=523847 RepID=A0A6A9QQD9_SULME|nr:hypothetical protein [Sulfuracidifex metallicus]MUN28023.1 hypothetical protein [Sulfuracidifex metallicus DSM 6482 = JCM 9184]WOE51430.1 hypothetical protein RQ359_000720 [Sulfuracidifex metallicus DSM 6482 = JCM 9184]